MMDLRVWSMLGHSGFSFFSRLLTTLGFKNTLMCLVSKKTLYRVEMWTKWESDSYVHAT